MVKCVEHTPYFHVKGGGEDKVGVEKGKEDPRSN
jgi:hypothetical protein